MPHFLNTIKFHILFIAATLVSIAVCRQMCYSCNYVGNSIFQGYECVTFPQNWTFGNWRLRCPNLCTTQAIYNKESGKSTYMARGCSGSMEVPDDNCEEDDLNIRCYFSCQGHYCNDGPGIDDKLLEKITPDGASSSHISLLGVLLETLLALLVRFYL